VIHCSMELGGNAPFIVFDDADMDKALDGAMIAKMRNGGEACTAANRLYVQRGIADEFARRLTERMQALKVGPGVNEDTDCGPLIDAAAVRKVAELVDDAVSKGAKVLCGGRQEDPDSCFYPPTVLTDVPADAVMAREEIFGPVAPLYVFDTEDEVIARANDTEYGLVAYVYTTNLARGLRVSERLEAGMLALNRGLVSDPAAPFGGVKQSGLGREGAHHGMLEFMEAKYIATDW
jgi:succinate-semialdehyde dehydrogenase/glutarate-semialdehyde dehydrogenase